MCVNPVSWLFDVRIAVMMFFVLAGSPAR